MERQAHFRSTTGQIGHLSIRSFIYILGETYSTYLVHECRVSLCDSLVHSPVFWLTLVCTTYTGDNKHSTRFHRRPHLEPVKRQEETKTRISKHVQHFNSKKTLKYRSNLPRRTFPSVQMSSVIHVPMAPYASPGNKFRRQPRDTSLIWINWLSIRHSIRNV